MNKERTRELLNAVIKNISRNESDYTVIQYLLYIGFTKKELVEDFGYDEETVQDASDNMDEYEDTLIFA